MYFVFRMFLRNFAAIYQLTPSPGLRAGSGRTDKTTVLE
jgi:hypothetical protein